MHALHFFQHGGPEVLQYGELPDPPYDEDALIVDMAASGMNFADVHRRRGNAHVSGEKPYILGYEGAGIVTSVGGNVRGWNVGDGVCFADCPRSNATRVSVDAQKAIPLPEWLSPVDAASILLQGLTALYLIEDSFQITGKETVVVHAAGGGVGRLLVRLLSARGARVIGIASTEEKRRAASRAGAEHVISPSPAWVDEVKAISQNGVHVVYDSVGITLTSSLSALKPGGRVVFFGTAGGQPRPIDPHTLEQHSLGVIGADLWTYLDSQEARLLRAKTLFNLIDRGILCPPTATRFTLSEGRNAHRLFEDRAFGGKIVFVT